VAAPGFCEPVVLECLVAHLKVSRNRLCDLNVTGAKPNGERLHLTALMSPGKPNGKRLELFSNGNLLEDDQESRDDQSEAFHRSPSCLASARCLRQLRAVRRRLSPSPWPSPEGLSLPTDRAAGHPEMRLQ